MTRELRIFRGIKPLTEKESNLSSINRFVNFPSWSAVKAILLRDFFWHVDHYVSEEHGGGRYGGWLGKCFQDKRRGGKRLAAYLDNRSYLGVLSFQVRRHHDSAYIWPVPSFLPTRNLF